MDTSKQPMACNRSSNSVTVLIMPKVTQAGTERFFRDYENAEKYGIEVRKLTPRHDKRGYGFSVRSRGQRLRGYVSSRGDLIVRTHCGQKEAQ